MSTHEWVFIWILRPRRIGGGHRHMLAQSKNVFRGGIPQPAA
jgi:hypothetical protein